MLAAAREMSAALVEDPHDFGHGVKLQEEVRAPISFLHAEEQTAIGAPGSWTPSRSAMRQPRRPQMSRRAPVRTVADEPRHIDRIRPSSLTEAPQNLDDFLRVRWVGLISLDFRDALLFRSLPVLANGAPRHNATRKGSLITDRRDYLYLVVREESGAS